MTKQEGVALARPLPQPLLGYKKWLIALAAVSLKQNSAKCVMNKLWYIEHKSDKFPAIHKWRGDNLPMQESINRSLERVTELGPPTRKWATGPKDFVFAYVYEHINPLLYRKLKNEWWMENQNYDHKKNPFWYTIYWNPLFRQAKPGLGDKSAYKYDEVYKKKYRKGFPYLWTYTLLDPSTPYVLNVEGPATLIIENHRLQYNMGRLLVHRKAWTNLLTFYDEVNEVDSYEELKKIAVGQEKQKLWDL